MSNNADCCNCAPDEHNPEVEARPDYKPAEGSCLTAEIVKAKENGPRFQWITLSVYRDGDCTIIEHKSEGHAREFVRQRPTRNNCHVCRIPVPPYV